MVYFATITQTSLMTCSPLMFVCEPFRTSPGLQRQTYQQNRPSEYYVTHNQTSISYKSLLFFKGTMLIRSSVSAHVVKTMVKSTIN